MGLAPQSEVKAKERQKNLSYFESSLKLLRKANYSAFVEEYFRNEQLRI
jgi:hypothetical protein